MPAALAEGALVADRFELGPRIASGGMGTIHRARDRHTGLAVALKVVRIEGEAFVERFEREAGILALADHPAIVHYVAHGALHGGLHYLVMEWVDGETLFERLRDRGLTLREAVALGVRLSDALSAVHRLGVVHRDIKPRNLMLPDGAAERVKLIDFGVATRPQSMRLTHPGEQFGTPGYMSPEQTRGLLDIDARSDVFSLGCVLYLCLAGRPPFVGDGPVAVRAKVLFEEPMPLDRLCVGLPDGVSALVARMLSKDPAHRPADGSAAFEALGEIAARIGSTEAGAPSPADPTTLPTLIVRVPEAPEGPGPVPRITAAEQRVLCFVLLRADPSTDVSKLESVVSPLGARVDALSPDTWVASFLGREAARDQALRAASAAIALVRALPEATVVVVTGRGVAARSPPLGVALDRGVALLEETSTGAVGLDEVSAGLLVGRYEIGGRDGRLVLDAPREQGEAIRHLLGRPTRFVGRERELASLEGWIGALTDPVARVLLVTGPAGIGKSRLLRELRARLEARSDPFALLVGRGDPIRSGAPLTLLADAMRRAADVAPSEAPEIARRKVRARLARVLDGPALDRASEPIEALVHGPTAGQLEPDPARVADATLAAWIDWLDAETQVHPVVLALEDLHWGDRPSIQFVDHALRALRERPLIVVAFARPELHVQFPGLWVERGVQEVRLGPLDRRAGEALARQAIPDLRDADVALLVERAQGNPFALEELVRAFAARSAADLPETVLGLLQARLDRLGEPARRALRAASVFGCTFPEAAVRAFVGAREAVFREWLDDLTARELLVREPGAAGGRFTFRHPIIRDAAYAMLPETDRRAGHRLAARWLERAGGEDAATIADHFDRAGEAAPAAEWFSRAAEQALAATDLEGALVRARRVEELGGTGEARGRARFVEAEVHRWRGDYARSERAGVAAAQDLPPGSDAWFRALEGVLTCGGNQGRADQVERTTREALAIVGEARSPACIRFVAQAVITLSLAGRHPLADSLARSLQALDLESLDPATAGHVANAGSLLSLQSGDLSGFLAQAERAVAFYRRARDPRRTLAVLSNLAFACMELGDLGRAEELLRSVIAQAERTDLRIVATMASATLTPVLLAQGRIDEAATLATKALANVESAHSPRAEVGVRTRLAAVHLARGDVAAARAQASLAVQMSSVAPPLRARALATAARVAIAAGSLAEAIALAAEAVQLADSEVRVESGESLVRLVWVEALEAAGRVDESIAAARRARERLLERADRIRDPAWRERFLRAVTENAETLRRSGG